MPEPAPRRSLFTVWRWPRWAWAIVVSLALVTYPFTAVPVSYFIVRAGLQNTPTQQCFEVIYAPIIWSVDNLEIARNIFQWQVKGMLSTFGEL